MVEWVCMWRLMCVAWICSLSPVFAVDHLRGPLVVSISDKWKPIEEAGPELLKAHLASNPTATLSIWKYNPGSMSPDQFLSSLREDLGWSRVSTDLRADQRFGRTNVGVYKKSGAYEELPFKIRSYDFLLDGDIYVLEMRAPESLFDLVDPEFQDVFANLAKSSRTLAPAPAASPLSPNSPLPAPGLRPITDPRISAASPPPDGSKRIGDGWTEGKLIPRMEPPPEERPKAAARPAPAPAPAMPSLVYSVFYRTLDGLLVGFDPASQMAALLSPDGRPQSVFPVTGTPLLAPDGIHVLTEDYAYTIDPKTGSVTSRVPSGQVVSSKIISSLQKPAPHTLTLTSVPPARAVSVASALSAPSARPGAPEGDIVAAAIHQAEGLRSSKGVRPALEFLMGHRPVAEKSQSPHLYEFYFRLGEYWEETGDLETALAYYRLATKAID